MFDRRNAKSSAYSAKLIYATKCSVLYCARHLAGTEAPGTDINTARCTVDNCLYAPDVRLPSSVGTSVRVGYLYTKGHTLVANPAFSHIPAPPFKRNHKSSLFGRH